MVGSEDDRENECDNNPLDDNISLDLLRNELETIIQAYDSKIRPLETVIKRLLNGGESRKNKLRKEIDSINQSIQYRLAKLDEQHQRSGNIPAHGRERRLSLVRGSCLRNERIRLNNERNRRKNPLVIEYNQLVIGLSNIDNLRAELKRLKEEKEEKLTEIREKIAKVAPRIDKQSTVKGPISMESSSSSYRGVTSSIINWEDPDLIRRFLDDIYH